MGVGSVVWIDIDPIEVAQGASKTLLGIAWLGAGVQLMYNIRKQTTGRVLMSASRYGLVLFFMAMIWDGLHLFLSAADDIVDLAPLLIASRCGLAILTLWVWIRIRANLIVLPSGFLPHEGLASSPSTESRPGLSARE
jgi:hypothetical protein